MTHPSDEVDPPETRMRQKRRAGRRLSGPTRELSVMDRLRYRAEYYAFRGIELFARALGLERSAGVSAFIWRHIASRTSRHARAREQLAAAMPDLSPAEQDRILDEMWDNLGRTFAEGFFLQEILEDESRLEVDPVAEELSRRGAVVYATLHTGNWEVAGAAATRIGCLLAGVYQVVKNPYVEAHALALRSPLYRGGLHEKGSNLVHGLTAWTSAGNPVGIVSDLRDPRGITVPFFDLPAPSTPFPAFLARKVGVPLLAIRVVRLPGSRFRVEMAEIAVPQTDKRMDDIRDATAQLHRTFEAWIREFPGQWMWIHRRWG